MFAPSHPLLQAGLAHQRQQAWQEAARCYRDAAGEAALESRFLLGWLAYEQQQGAEAIDQLTAVVAADPGFYAAWVLLGNLALLAGNVDEALSHFHTAQTLEPQDLGLAISIGQAWLAKQNYPEAIMVLANLLQACPEHLQGWLLLAQAYGRHYWTFHQVQCLERALALSPDDPGMMETLAHAWLYLGQHDALKRYFENILQLSPAGQAWFARLPPQVQEGISTRLRIHLVEYLLLLYADPSVTDQQLFSLVAALSPANTALRPERQAGPLQVATLPAETLPQPLHEPLHEPLRVAYFSREFGRYSPMQLFWPLLRHHTAAVELYAYDDHSLLVPESQPYQSWFAHWRRTFGCDDATVADQIRADGIDILVDLAGLTHAGRHGLFALRPAPVQVSGLGFLFSSGLAEIDYCFSDPVLCPPLVAAHYPETVVHLSSAFHWQPPEPFAIGAPPCQSQGFITLGSASGLNKLNLAVISLWARLLQALPQAMLFLKTPVFDDPLTRSFYRELFAHFGIDSRRLRLEGQGAGDHVSYFYPQIDIALDPFPYQGGVTTGDALWMGVPVVCLQQPQWRSRALTASILTAMGLESWLAQSEEAYCERVLAWAANRDFLTAQRQTLRPRLLASPICDGPGFAAEVEAAYSWMWRQAQGGQV